MNIIAKMKKELKDEAELLKNYRASTETVVETALYCKRPEARSKQFFYRNRGEKKIRYIRKGDRLSVMKLVVDAFNFRACEVLVNNISILDKAICELQPYDSESIVDSLPDAYKDALEEYGEGHAEDNDRTNQTIKPETPSENSFKMKNKYPVSNGLIVRSKSEALIAEYLLAAGIAFRYEKALDLVNVTNDDAGYEYVSTERVYPDFTIYLPDGSVLLWEHEGMMDTEKYRKRNLRKLMLYFRNGYYVPKNLIFTMESDDKPLDTDAIRRIIDGFIKPLYV